jgi:hypothetical protein
VKPLNSSNTNITAPVAAVAANATAVAANLTEVRALAGSGDDSATMSDGSMVQQLAAQFRLVYTASSSYNLKNLSATEMFQVF